MSRDGTYHNGKFKAEAESRGLIISQAKYIGWSVTQPSPEFIEVIKSHGIEKPMDINRDGIQIDIAGLLGGLAGLTGVDGVNGLTVAKKPKCSTRKYVCPCCGNSLRATKDINIICGDCMEQFVKVEKENNS